MGKTKQLIDTLIARRAKGVEHLEINTRMKLLMKGIDAKRITDTTPDDVKLIDRIYLVAKELNIQLD